MHQDFDVMWFKKPPARILEAQAAFQNTETTENTHGFYKPLMEDAKDKDFKLNKYCNLDLIRAYNCGIICFNDLSKIKEWYDLAIDYINKNKNNLPLTPIFFEQFLIYNFLEYYNFKVEILGKDWIDEKTAVKYGYTHLISESKRKKDIEEKVAIKLAKTKSLLGI